MSRIDEENRIDVLVISRGIFYDLVSIRESNIRDGKTRSPEAAKVNPRIPSVEGLAASTLILRRPSSVLAAVRLRGELMFSQLRTIDFTSNMIIGVRLPARLTPTSDSMSVCARNRVKPSTIPVKFG